MFVYVRVIVQSVPSMILCPFVYFFLVHMSGSNDNFDKTVLLFYSKTVQVTVQD